METTSRRSFIQGVAAVAGLSATSAFATQSMAAENSLSATGDSSQDWMPADWDGEADVVILGTGAAGLAAAIEATDQGLTPLVLEAAPQEHEGGNSRVCHQLVFTADSVDNLVEYQTFLNGDYEVEPELVQAWAENMQENEEWLTKIGAKINKASYSEYPDAPGSEACAYITAEEGTGNARIWQFIKDAFDERGCEVIYEARATRLIFDPTTKEVYGVRTEDGRNYKAKRGVIVACGGFENNTKMMQDCYEPGYPNMGIFGTPYNRGDGIEMAEQIGAKLWHMGAFCGPYYGPAVADVTDVNPDWDERPFVPYLANIGYYAMWDNAYDWIMVDGDCKRYRNEDLVYECKHGKVYRQSTWVSQDAPNPAWIIAGSKIYAAGDKEGGPICGSDMSVSWANMMGYVPSDVTNQGFIDGGIMTVCENYAEVADVLGVDEEVVKTCIETYNQYCDNGLDPEYHRGESYTLVVPGVQDSGTSVDAHELQKIEAPFYVFKFIGGLVNTQGGPKRCANGQWMDIDENPIPRVFGAGELGDIYGYRYNGGGNFAEAMSSGRLAARSIAELEPWE